MSLSHRLWQRKEALIDWMAEHVTQRRVALVAVVMLIVSVANAALVTWFAPDIAAMDGTSPLAVLSVEPALLIGFFGLYHRHFWGGPMVALSLALYVGLILPEPFVSVTMSYGTLAPTVVALLVARFWWMPVVQTITFAVLIWRADFQGVYTSPMVLNMTGLFVGCLMMNRVLTELSNRRTAAALMELQRTNDTLDSTVQARTAALETERDNSVAIVEQQRVSYRQVSHDLRGDLSRITSSMDFLYDAYCSGDPVEIQVNWRRLTRWVRRINSFAADLLDVAVLDRLQLRPDIVSFTDVLCSIVDEMHVDAELYRVELILGSCQNLPLVWCDADRIGRVLRNLVGNAIKYTYGVGDHVRVDAIAFDDAVVCSVVDDGPGIEPHQFGRLGQEFVRLGPDNKGPAGTGIGLNFCRHLIRMSGGTFTMTSAGSGAGTIVTFTVPIYNGQDEPSQFGSGFPHVGI